MTRAALASIVLVALLAGPAPALEVTARDGVRLHVVDEGSGEPVLLLHGLGASAELNWRLPGLLRAVTGEGFRAIAPDARGHGRSAAPASPGGYGAQMIDDAVAVLDAVGVERAHVVGYSMGGMVALALAARHPGRVRSVVLGGMGWLREGSRLQDALGRVPRGPGVVAPEGCMASLADLALTADEVRGVAAPVTVIVGDRDPCRRLYVEPLRALRPDWPVHVVPGAGHLSAVASPVLRDRLVEALQASAVH